MSVGVSNLVVKLISAKTKINPQDVADVIKAMAECVPQAFLELDPPEEHKIGFGAFNLCWRYRFWCGPRFIFSATRTVTDNINRMIINKSNPMAHRLFDLLTETNKKAMLGKKERGGYDYIEDDQL